MDKILYINSTTKKQKLDVSATEYEEFTANSKRLSQNDTVYVNKSDLIVMIQDSKDLKDFSDKLDEM